MSLQQIKSDDIATWDSLEDVAESLKKRGLQPEPSLGEDNELVLRLTDDDEFMVLIKAPPGETAASFKSRTNVNTHTGMVATDDFEEFTFITRIRTWDAHGRTKYQQLSFSKEQMTSETGEKNTILQKLNNIEFNKPETIFNSLYDTKQVVKDFYEDFEELRTELVQEVAGIPDDRGDAKQRYVQVTLDRMIFLYFIQEKGLLDHDTEYLHKMHEQFSEDGDVYEEFYDPLFFDILAEGKKDTTYGNLPYLNGGLFSKNPVEEEFDDARLGETAEETSTLFGKILSFLSDWNWNVDERLDIVDPKNLSPAILGHIFEQTVNQKEMGAYYTPEEITGFMSRRTVHPWLLDRVNDTHGTNYEAIDDIFELDVSSVGGDKVEAMADGGIAQTVDLDAVNQEHVKTLYFDALNELRVLDPAVGSGAFLLAAQEVLLDIYLQCIEYFQALRDEQPWELHGEVEEELDKIDATNGTATLYAKNQIILNNLYGVDIDEGGVEICKLRLWLSMVADIENEPKEVEPLPNIDFNIRQGNSLVGFVDSVEPSGNPEQTTKENSEGTTIGDWNVRSKYQNIRDAVKKYRDADTSSEAVKHRKNAEELMDKYREEFNEDLLEEFHDAGLDDVDISDVEDFDPFHWMVEFAFVWGDGKFDVVIGNPPWDRIKPLRDDFFSKYDETFRTRLPDEKDAVQEELLSDETISKGWEKYQDEMETRAEYFKKSRSYKLQRPEIDGRIKPNPNDLSSLFFERVFSLADDSSRVAQILPGAIFNGASCKDLRTHLLDTSQVDVLTIFQNNGIFDQIHHQYKFGILIFQNEGSTQSVSGKYSKGSLEILKKFDSEAISIPREVLTKYSPEAKIFPYVESETKLKVLRKIIRNPELGDENASGWYMEPYQGLRRTSDSDRFVDESVGEYPVYGGSNIYQFNYSPEFIGDIEPPKFWSVEPDTDPERSAKQRMREKTVRDLKRAIYETFDGSGSQKSFVNELLEENRGKPLSEDDVLLDSSEYRIVLRDITNATNERTLIAAVIPKGVVCHNTLRTIRNFRIEPYEEGLKEDNLHSFYQTIFTDEELFAGLGLINSLPFDYLLRTKVDTHVVTYKFKESQVPHLTNDDNWFHYISERAARLNCYGDEFTEMRERLGDIEASTDENERMRLQAEIDAAAFHAYGLDRRDTEFVLDDFHRVNKPRVMTEEYFDLVFEKYDELTETGPHP
ncbi:type II restriction endonuclease subunit M [Haloferax sp. Atlit-10N]|uniref:Eco57I restriction-modification methylase domain-containing protein n=1 Tax=unclassified Haloferax TaxID=2625095 RepID=UPI000E26B9C5|nr:MULTISPECIES: DNA methyltransferase [unclassified Haloferax]RDZ44452.1 type II restriction endonuclease subunit M [Haloferax sp. Atlit-16N]RDZ56261.1 type II restriction endonuclease subunit M [Haloferax sp. Atlit-10N]